MRVPLANRLVEALPRRRRRSSCRPKCGRQPRLSEGASGDGDKGGLRAMIRKPSNSGLDLTVIENMSIQHRVAWQSWLTLPLNQSFLRAGHLNQDHNSELTFLGTMKCWRHAQRKFCASLKEPLTAYLEGTIHLIMQSPPFPRRLIMAKAGPAKCLYPIPYLIEDCLHRYWSSRPARWLTVED